MTMRLWPFPGKEWTVNVPGHYIGYVCHACPKTMIGQDLYIPYQWTLKSCEIISTGGGKGCQDHLYVSLVEVMHQDFVGENTHQIEIESNPLGAKVTVK